MKRKNPAQPAVSQRAGGSMVTCKKALASGGLAADLGDFGGYALEFPAPIYPSEALEPFVDGRGQFLLPCDAAEIHGHQHAPGQFLAVVTLAATLA
jgi:hypothetical protein